ncbi:hypothetical protein OAG34_00530 [bacterium]|nr:hypothetical protein [bacterium]
MGLLIDTILYRKHVYRGKPIVAPSVDPTGTIAVCGSPQGSIPCINAVLKWCVTLAIFLLLVSATPAAECESCDDAECQCASVCAPLGDMGCISNDLMDLSVGSDSMPGVMSHCQCQDCNSTRFANQFCDALTHCEGYQPQWLATSGVLAFTRVTQSAAVLVSDSTDPIRQINRADFDFDWQLGLDLSIRRIKWNENSFELRFMGIDSIVANTTTIAGGTTEIHAALPVFVNDITSIDANYTSDLYGIEANWQFVTYCPFQYIAGIRYIGFNEQLSIDLNSPTSPLAYRTSTHNDLYGVQVGVTSIPDMPLLDCRWLSWSAKVGLFGNDAEQTSILTGTVGQRADSPADTAAFAGEFKLGMEIPLTNCLSVSGGYTLFLMERVAVASDQLQATNFFTGTGSDDEGNALFHGGSVAITLTF